MINCVTVKTNHIFPGNQLASMFRLRYRSVIERQSWQVPTWEDMEYDEFDNLATTYFIWCDENNEARGCARLYPTDRPYMLRNAFSHLVSYEPLPTDDKSIWEGSRLCVDKDLPPEVRRRIIFELNLAYMEFALPRGIKKIIGVMLPAYWRSVYTSSGWTPFWYGDVHTLNNGDRVRAGGLPVSDEVMANIRRVTGIFDSVLNLGRDEVQTQKKLGEVA